MIIYFIYKVHVYAENHLKTNFNEMILRIINYGISHNTDSTPLGRQNHLVFWFAPIQEAKVLDQSDCLVIHIFPSNLVWIKIFNEYRKPTRLLQRKQTSFWYITLLTSEHRHCLTCHKFSIEIIVYFVTARFTKVK